MKLPQDNLYELRLKRKRCRAYWRKHGATTAGTPVKLYKFPNGWQGVIFGPYEPMPRDCFDTNYQYIKAKKAFLPFHANLSFFYIIKDYPWTSGQFEGLTFNEVYEKCLAFTSKKSNIYDPERSLIDGVWFERDNIEAARLEFKQKLEQQAIVDKAAYLRDKEIAKKRSGIK
jgi:hypothetical protein